MNTSAVARRGRDSNLALLLRYLWSKKLNYNDKSGTSDLGYFSSHLHLRRKRNAEEPLQQIREISDNVPSKHKKRGTMHIEQMYAQKPAASAASVVRQE
ncbi:unnamed protein product [Litomosoides sigmodontis]|uniref:Uncharacterized protein n=1 Tax=Litomosoides sigmodontis TaxID=42156 RepID=A0A3P6U5I1_LITSI|nr:unnamed protein product [Litomosoides sigmodontis]